MNYRQTDKHSNCKLSFKLCLRKLFLVAINENLIITQANDKLYNLAGKGNWIKHS